MPEKSSFFNSIAGDRKYKAVDFASYFNKLITNGVFPNPSTNLQIISNNNMTVTIKAGAAWINGYIYILDEDMILPIAVADGLLKRIDRVVIRFDTVGRAINAVVKPGTFASTPIAPVLQRDSDKYELGVGDVLVNNGAVSISQANITDQRFNTSLCGILNSLITADTTTLFNQYNDGFNTWFAGIQNILDANAAGNLLTKINELAGAGRTTETVKENTAAIATKATGTGTASGTNTGDETLATIKSKLGVTVLSGSNTGDQDLSAMQTQVTAVASGSPKGVYATLSALQNAFPTGNTNIYLVTADGKWYYWNVSTWTIGGVYQGIGLADKIVTAPKINSIPRNVIGLEQMAQSVINMFNKSTITNSGFIIDNTGALIANASLCVSDYIPVIEGQVYTVSKGLNSMGGCYNDSKNWVIKIPAPASETIPYSFTVPLGIRFIKINLYLSALNTFMLNNDATISPTYIPYTGKIIPSWLTQTLTSKWAGKKWNVIGDSITERNIIKSTKNYQDYISDKIGCVVNNYGISGTGWRTPSSGGALAIYNRIATTDSTADLITVFAGTNDYGETGVPFVLGALGDTTTATFYGTLDNVLNQLITKYPIKAIAVFTPLPDGGMWGAKGYTMQSIADAIIQVANKYSIPVLDLFRINNLNINNTFAKDYYFKDVNSVITIHPNDAGHIKLADKILAFLNTL